MTTDKYVFFWGGAFSQWALAPITMGRTTFNCNEQYMMWRKAQLFNDYIIMDKILKEKNPREQKALGRQVKDFNQEVWETKCRHIVFAANYAKFTQHPELRKLLLETGDKIIVEASSEDKIWGIGMAETEPGIEDPKNWKGTNWLGEAIMQVRRKLIEGV